MIKIDKNKGRCMIIAILEVAILLLLLFMASKFILYMKLQRTGGNTVEKLEEDLPQKETIIDYVEDGSIIYTIISRSGRTDYGDLLAVYEQGESGSCKRIYENDFENLKPWKIERADVDGDGESEILTGVWKTTRYDKTEKNRLFVFNYTKGKLVKKWTGSDIAGIWEDFTVGDLLSVPGDELIFIEKTDMGDEKASIYYWFDFGFLRLAESKSFEDILKLSILEENRIQISYKGEKEEISTFTVKNGKIVEIIK